MNTHKECVWTSRLITSHTHQENRKGLFLTRWDISGIAGRTPRVDPEMFWKRKKGACPGVFMVIRGWLWGEGCLMWHELLVGTREHPDILISLLRCGTQGEEGKFSFKSCLQSGNKNQVRIFHIIMLGFFSIYLKLSFLGKLTMVCVIQPGQCNRMNKSFGYRCAELTFQCCLFSFHRAIMRNEWE